MFSGKNKPAHKAEAGSEKAGPVLSTASNKKPEAVPAASLKEFPLFFSRPHAVNNKRHAKAGINTTLLPSFARATNSIPVNAVELGEAAKHYPIVFTARAPIMPLAIVGLEQENIFVDTNGTWRERTYIPAYVRKHPFVFAEEEGSSALTLCVDEDSSYFVKDARGPNIARLFENGEATAYTTKVLSFCTAFHEQYLLTGQFCSALERLGMLEPNRSDIALATGRKISLGGFRLLDPKKFAALSENDILELHRQGWLPLIHYILLSSSNWTHLIDIASRREKAS